MFGFLRGELKCVVKNKEYVKVYEVVMHQCDNNDNGGKLYQYVQLIFKDYITNEALPLIKQRQDQG